MLNKTLLPLLVSDKVTLVGVRFQQRDGSKYDIDSDEISDYRFDSKVYTYKTVEDFSIGELATVFTPYGFAVVYVCEVDVEPDVESTKKYKWIIGKVDLEPFNRLVDWEDELIRDFNSKQTSHVRQRVLESYGLSPTDLPAIPFTKGE